MSIRSKIDISSVNSKPFMSWNRTLTSMPVVSLPRMAIASDTFLLRLALYSSGMLLLSFCSSLASNRYPATSETKRFYINNLCMLMGACSIELCNGRTRLAWHTWDMSGACSGSSICFLSSRTLAIASKGQGPFSFCKAMGTARPKKSMRLSL